MPATSMPSRRAARAWPISWAMIEPKNRNASATAARKTAVSEASVRTANCSRAKKIARNRIRNHE